MQQRNLRGVPAFTVTMIVLLSAVGCQEKTKPKTYTEEAVTQASQRANAFFDSVFDARLERHPMQQSYLGIKTHQDQWDDLSETLALQELEIIKNELQVLQETIDPQALDIQTRISYQLFKEDCEHELEDYSWRNYYYPVNQMHGWQSRIPSFLINIHRIENQADAEAYIARLNGVPKLIDQIIDDLKACEAKGVVAPRFVYPRVIDDCGNVINGAPFDGGKPSTLLADFTTKIDTLLLDTETKNTLTTQAIHALTESVKPAYEKLITFLKEQETRATTDDGVWKFPNGLAFYNNALKRRTTTDLTAEEIHQIGLDEVARIHQEIEAIMKQVAFQGSLQDFFVFLRDDPQFYYPNTPAGKEACLDSLTHIIDNMRTHLDELFITKPKAPIVVKAVEPFREKSAGSAFYQRAAPDGSRPGTFYANLYDTRDLPKFEMEALAYHEGIPGHHMDRSISQELTDIPKFRKYGGYTAYVEGWGLYCEYIPKEMGMYQNPYADYGRLSMELWRACRLVVDTGIHLKKWTREQGIDYYRTNTSGSDRECERMVERHIVMPGQATAYKIGMMKILELRHKAEQALGDQFDIRQFHDVVLTSGSVPLSILEENVNQYIASAKG